MTSFVAGEAGSFLHSASTVSSNVRPSCNSSAVAPFSLLHPFHPSLIPCAHNLPHVSFPHRSSLFVFHFTRFRFPFSFYAFLHRFRPPRLTSVVHVTPVTCIVPFLPSLTLGTAPHSFDSVSTVCVRCLRYLSQHSSHIACMHCRACIAKPAPVLICSLSFDSVSTVCVRCLRPRPLTPTLVPSVDSSVRYNHIRVHTSYSGFGSVSDHRAQPPAIRSPPFTSCQEPRRPCPTRKGLHPHR
jgi:hypothetical protein